MATAHLKLPPNVERAVVRRAVAASGLWARLAGPGSVEPEVQTVLVLRRLKGASGLGGGDPETIRREIRAESLLHAPRPDPSLRTVEFRLALPSGAKPARLYKPGGAAVPGLLLFFHGGGYVFGDVDTHDSACRALASSSGLSVFSVEYALSPEHRCGAAIADGLAAWAWVQANAEQLGVDAGRVVMGGDSAGGNLTAVVVRRLREQGAVMPAGQALIYPAVDRVELRDSLRRCASGYLLETSEIEWFHEQYTDTTDFDRGHPDVSPYRGDLHGQPPAVVVTAGYDPLSDEGIDYAAKLDQSGVAVTRLHFARQIHGFINLVGVSAACVRDTHAIGRAIAGLLAR